MTRDKAQQLEQVIDRIHEITKTVQRDPRMARVYKAELAKLNTKKARLHRDLSR
jgi:hypothetical protein